MVSIQSVPIEVLYFFIKFKSILHWYTSIPQVHSGVVKMRVCNCECKLSFTYKALPAICLHMAFLSGIMFMQTYLLCVGSAFCLGDSWRKYLDKKH